MPPRNVRIRPQGLLFGVFSTIVATGTTPLAAQELGYSCTVLEKGKVANTIENFPEGKWVYAEPDQTPAKGKLWLDGARKEELVDRWNGIVRDNDLEVRVEEPLVEVPLELPVVSPVPSSGSGSAGHAGTRPSVNASEIPEKS